MVEPRVGACGNKSHLKDVIKVCRIGMHTIVVAICVSLDYSPQKFYGFNLVITVRPRKFIQIINNKV